MASCVVRSKVEVMSGVHTGPGATALTRMPAQGGVRGKCLLQ